MAADFPHKGSAEINQSAEKESHDSSAKFSTEAATAQREGSSKLTSVQFDTASQHLPSDFTITDSTKPAPKPESPSFWGNVAHQGMLFGEGVVSGSIGNAYNGVKQLVDHATGEQYKPTELFSNQKEVDASIAGKIGSAVGTVADFAALTVASGGALGAVGLAGVGEGAIAVGAAGAFEGGILTPSDDKNFASGRLIDAGIGAAAGVVGLRAGLAVKALTEGVGGVAGTGLRVGGGIGIGATLGAGVTEATSLATTGDHASASQIEFGAATGAAGGALGGLRFGSKAIQESSNDDRTPAPPETQTSSPAVSANAQLIEGMRTGAVKFAEKSLDSEPRKAVSASVEVDGHAQDVLIRGAQNPADATADKFHQLTDFTSAIPRTTSRTVESLGPEGEQKFSGTTHVDVQERVGKLLSDLQESGAIKQTDAQLTKRVGELSTKGTNDPLAQQIEQAVAERAIIGDNDVIDFNNITLSHENGQWKAANIDFETEHGAFSTEHEPWGTSPLSGMPISEGTLSKIGTTVNRLETEEGRKSLTAMGLSDKQAEALIARAKYLLTNKHFPPPTGYDLD